MMARHDFSISNSPEYEFLGNWRKGTAPHVPPALVFITVEGKLVFELLL